MYKKCFISIIVIFTQTYYAYFKMKNNFFLFNVIVAIFICISSFCIHLLPIMYLAIFFFSYSYISFTCNRYFQMISKHIDTYILYILEILTKLTKNKKKEKINRHTHTHKMPNWLFV